MNLSDFNLSNFKETISNDLFENLLDSFLSEIQNKLNNFQTTSNSLSDEITYFTVDRLEENYAVLENRNNQKMINVPIDELPNDIKNGQILKFANDSYSVDNSLTEEISRNIEHKSNNLFK